MAESWQSIWKYTCNNSNMNKYSNARDICSRFAMSRYSFLPPEKH